jgi:hypothetical protein
LALNVNLAKQFVEYFHYFAKFVLLIGSQQALYFEMYLILLSPYGFLLWLGSWRFSVEEDLVFGGGGN